MGRNRFAAIAMPKTSKFKRCDGASDSGWMCHHIHPKYHARLRPNDPVACLKGMRLHRNARLLVRGIQRHNRIGVGQA
jgi:hypothetical protein